MATENTVSQLSGQFKEVYANQGIDDAVPRFGMLTKMIKFREAERQGDSYHFPVVLSREHGVTFAGGSSAGDAFSLEEAEASVSKDANLSGTACVGRAKLSYGAASRATSKGKRAFINATEHVVTNLRETMGFYLELMLLYGNRGVAKIGSVSGSGSTRTWTISKDTWAPGVWAQFVNGYLDVYDNESLSSKQNSNAVVQVTAVDVANRQLSVSGNSSDLSSISADAWIVPRGWKSNTFSGAIDILANTGSLFGIDASTYPLWQTASFDAGSAALTMGKVQSALTNAVGQGLMDDMEVCVSPYTWADLNTDHAALRRFQENTKAQVNIGTQAITYWGPNGSARIVNHPMLYAGRAIGKVPRRWRRVGSSDVTFRLPNHPEGRFFRELQAAAGFELRAWFDQAVVCTVPAQQLYITNITNDSL
jgi:hypothetical protein